MSVLCWLGSAPGVLTLGRLIEQSPSGMLLGHCCRWKGSSGRLPLAGKGSGPQVTNVPSARSSLAKASHVAHPHRARECSPSRVLRGERAGNNCGRPMTNTVIKVAHLIVENSNTVLLYSTLFFLVGLRISSYFLGQLDLLFCNLFVLFFAHLSALS